MLPGMSSNVGILIKEDACGMGGNFVVDVGGIVVSAYDIKVEFLLGLIRTGKHLNGVRKSN